MKPITLRITGLDFSFSIALDASYKRGTITLTPQEALDLFGVLAWHHDAIWKAMVAEKQLRPEGQEKNEKKG